MKYGRNQAAALAALGCDVTLLVDADAPDEPAGAATVRRVLIPETPRRLGMPKALRLLQIAGRLLGNEWLLAGEVLRCRPNAVLLASYSEYLAPAWVWLQLATRSLTGAAFVAVLHDPVRDFVVGPAWWHALSVRLAFCPLSAVFVHEALPPAAAVLSRVVVREVPHGLYAAESIASRPPDVVRREWGVPPEAVVFLSFGFIRDGKNLDLCIRALRDNASAWLVVMGRVASASVCRPASFYKELAVGLGVAHRVKIIEGYVKDGELGSCLDAADAIALTYSASFHSQSGVLNTVAGAAKPLLASSGESPLKQSVLRFRLGEFVPPDDVEALSAGMARICSQVQANREGSSHALPAMDWEGFRRYASWETNARVILETVAEVRGGGAESLALRR